MKFCKLIFFILAIISIFTNCSNNKVIENCTNQNNVMTYASQIKLWEYNGYRIAEIKNPWDSTKNLGRYILVPKEGKLPDDLDSNDIIIRTPISSALVYTSVHAGALVELGVEDIITGVIDASFYKIEKVTAGLQNGSIINAGNSDAPIIEKIIELSPEAILLSVYQGMDNTIIDKLGIPQIKFTDNMEQTPLGRAEWIKFIGALTHTDSLANKIFKEVEENYTKLCCLTSNVERRPRILVENMYQGIWYVSGGGSYQAQIIKDAGGDYIWSDNSSTGSLNLSFEQVYDKAYDADIWLLKVFGYDLTYDILEATDKRNIEFKATKTGGVYYANTAEVNLFEEFPFHPDLLLKDYIKIFHPYLLSDHNLRYFKQMQY